MAFFPPVLDQNFRRFIREQRMFFVATAPRRGRVNVSPKGLDTLQCLDDQTIGYLDLTGSGIETAAHIEDNGRLTMMFCSFDDKPLILRLYGQAQVVRPRDPEWSARRAAFGAPVPGERQIILLHLESIQTSCGFGVPLFEFRGQRPTLLDAAVQKGEPWILQHWHRSNRHSIDGLPSRLLPDEPGS